MDMCESAENLRTGDGKQEYYLRYVKDEKFKENIAFTKSKNDPETGYYLSFDKEPGIKKKNLIVSKKSEDFATFTILGSKNGHHTQGFKILSHFDTNRDRRVLALSPWLFFLSMIDNEFFQTPSMHLDKRSSDHYSHYFDYNRETGTLQGAFPLGLILKDSYVCFQKVDHEIFKDQKEKGDEHAVHLGQAGLNFQRLVNHEIKCRGSSINPNAQNPLQSQVEKIDFRCPPDRLLAPNSLFVKDEESTCSFAVG